jgi:tetratricopeptide (TPR) repeat protein
MADCYHGFGMDRIVRDRGSVGRRIWRRRRKRASGTATTPAQEPAFELEEQPPPREEKKPEKRGFFAALFGTSSKKQRDVEPPYLVVDPTRDVLAVPRGAARLDAFERAIETCPAGTPQFRALALAFHKELQALAENAGVDLSLYETRVEACAKALIAAGEEERAGTLFLRVGRRHQAAELFVAAGAIDALEEAHAQIHYDEGGAKLDARMSFDRFEALYMVGLRDQAFDALERAHRLWRDNPVYSEIHRTFLLKLGPPKRTAFQSGSKSLVVVGAWPIVIGRGEEAAVRLTSPLISRAHLKIDLQNGEPVVVDLESRGGTRVAGVALDGKRALPDGADIDMGGVVVKTARSDGVIWLTPALALDRRTAAITGPVALDGIGRIRFDGRGRAVLDPPAEVNGQKLVRPLVLLEGDRIGPWVVTRGT